MAEKVEVFSFAYRDFEVLINAADYFALVPGAECSLDDGRSLADAAETGLPALDWLTAKGQRYQACLVAPLAARLAAPTARLAAPTAERSDPSGAQPDATANGNGGGGEAIITCAFLMRLEGGRSLAVVATRGFELKEYDLADFRLVPRSLRARLGTLGLLCLRFETDGRLQLMLYPPSSRFCPAGGELK